MNRKKRMKRNKKIIFFIFVLLIGFVLLTNYNKLDNSKKIDTKPKHVIERKKNKKKQRKKMSLVAVGDCLIHDSIYMDAKAGDNSYDFSKILENVKPLIKDYDLKYYNQESIIGGKDLGLSNYPMFNSPDEIGDGMVDIGFNMVSLANNHALDKGEKGILYSNSYWDKKDVIHEGTYSSLKNRNNIKIYKQNDIKFAYLSYTTVTNGLKAPDGKEYLLNVYSNEQAQKDIEKIKDKVDVIIVAMHWGVEYTQSPNDEQKEIAKYLSSLGVDLIIGNHAHVIQPVDYVKDTLVMYGLGNFLASQRVIGVNMATGLMVGLDIVVEDKKVTFENIDYQLLYTSYNPKGTNYKIIPFKDLNNDILPNYKEVEKSNLDVVHTKVN